MIHKLPTLNNDLDYLLRTVRRRQVEIVESYLQERGLPLSAWYPLIVLNLGDGVSQRDLAKRLALKDAAVGKALDSLEKDRLVLRTVDDLDRRRILVWLTPLGRKIAEDLSTLRLSLLETMCEGFSEKERTQLRRSLQMVYSNLGRISAKEKDTSSSTQKIVRKRSSK